MNILEDLDVKAELIWIKLNNMNNIPLFVGAYYNPDSSLTSLNELDLSLQK